MSIIKVLSFGTFYYIPHLAYLIGACTPTLGGGEWPFRAKKGAFACYATSHTLETICHTKLTGRQLAMNAAFFLCFWASGYL